MLASLEKDRFKEKMPEVDGDHIYVGKKKRSHRGGEESRSSHRRGKDYRENEAIIGV